MEIKKNIKNLGDEVEVFNKRMLEYQDTIICSLEDIKIKYFDVTSSSSSSLRHEYKKIIDEICSSVLRSTHYKCNKKIAQQHTKIDSYFEYFRFEQTRINMLIGRENSMTALPLDNDEQTYINYILFMPVDQKIREFVDNYRNSPFEILRNKSVLKSVYEKIKCDDNYANFTKIE